MIENIIGILSTIVIILMVLLPLGMIKNEVTYRNQSKIFWAIYDYNMNLIRKGELETAISKGEYVSTQDMEDYDDTLNRFWDWGYTRILPPEKFELIKPFIRH